MPAATGKIRVIVGEQVPFLRRGICSIIKDMPDCDLIADTSDGDSLLELTAKNIPDVVVMDFNLPGISHEVLIRRLKEISSSCGVLVIGDSIKCACVMKCIQSGAAGYILQNALVEQLVETIRGVYFGEAVIDLSTVRHVADVSGSKVTTPSMAESLSSREMNTLRLAAKGLSNKMIAQELSMSTSSIHRYLRSIFSKMGVGSRTEAIYHAFREGWIDFN